MKQLRMNGMAPLRFMVTAGALLVGSVHPISGLSAAPNGSALDTDYSSASWAQYIAKGYVPYRKLALQDLRVDDQVKSTDRLYTSGFIFYDYQAAVSVGQGSTVRAVPTIVRVKAGLDSTHSWRRSDPSTASFLGHEQGHLDINELNAANFASSISTSLPQGMGRTPKEALAALDAELKRRFESAAHKNDSEQAIYDRETRGGLDQAAQARWSAAIAVQLGSVGTATPNGSPVWLIPQTVGRSGIGS